MEANLSVEPRRGWTRMVCTELARRTPAQQEQFTEEYDRRKKITSEAYAFWLLFGTHYAYLGKWGVQVIFWLTAAGFGLWWIIDVFRVGSLVRDHNENIATAVLRDMTTIWGHS